MSACDICGIDASAAHRRKVITLRVLSIKEKHEREGHMIKTTTTVSSDLPRDHLFQVCSRCVDRERKFRRIGIASGVGLTLGLALAFFATTSGPNSLLSFIGALPVTGMLGALTCGLFYALTDVGTKLQKKASAQRRKEDPSHTYTYDREALGRKDV
jgi:hypothetical protein